MSMRASRLRAARILLAACAVALGVSAAACEQKGPAERAGEKIDNAAKTAGEAVEHAGEKVKDAAK
jgi:hypothetical protein